MNDDYEARKKRADEVEEKAFEIVDALHRFIKGKARIDVAPGNDGWLMVSFVDNTNGW